MKLMRPSRYWRKCAPDALFVGPGAFFNSRRLQLATLAARHDIPASYAVRDYAEAGGGLDSTRHRP